MNSNTPTATPTNAYQTVELNLPQAKDQQMTIKVIDTYGDGWNGPFVRNWHGFGMGTLRSNVIGGGGGSNSQTERLMRFMQAHGIDTSHVRQETLTKFCKGGRYNI